MKRKKKIYTLWNENGKEVMTGDATTIAEYMGVEAQEIAGKERTQEKIFGYTVTFLKFIEGHTKEDETFKVRQLFGKHLEEWRYMNRRYGNALFTPETLAEWKTLNRRYGTRRK